MNLSPQWVTVLRQNGLDAQHWSAIGAVNADDVEIMAYARQASAVVITRDLDFSAILAASGSTLPSVIILRRAVKLNADTIKLLLSGIKIAHADLIDGAVLTVYEGRARLRRLPISSRAPLMPARANASSSPAAPARRPR